MAPKRQVRHGLRYHPLYGRWLMMRDRCNNKNNPAYHRYGGRGITVCEQWNDFSVFVSDMGLPNGKQTIERVDNAKGYSPENCVWASYHQQMRNTRRTRLVSNGFESMCIKDWADRIGINESSLRERIKKHPLTAALSSKKGEIHG